MPIQVTREQLSASEDMRMGRFTVRLQAKAGRNPEDNFALSLGAHLTFTAY